MTKQEKLELNWLRYFYNNASNAMGPADSEIYSMFKNDYLAEGNELPEEYKDEVYEE